MPRAKEIQGDDVAKIWQLKAEGKIVLEMLAIINRSKKSIYRIVYTECKYEVKPRPRVTNERDDHHIQRLASTQRVREVQRSSGGLSSKISVSKNTICRQFLETGTMIHFKVKIKPALKPQHKSQRMLWARNHMSYEPKWQSVIFSNEKKWNLDGPDGAGHRTGITNANNIGVFSVAIKVVAR